MKEYNIEIPNNTGLTDQEACDLLAKTFSSLGRYFEEKSNNPDTKIKHIGMQVKDLGFKIAVTKAQGDI